MPNEGMNIPHAKARGEWAELRFMTRATELGFRVTKPWGDSSPYDLATTPKRSRKQSEGSREAAQECSHGASRGSAQHTIAKPRWGERN
jgi:hypothetical protein